MKDKLLSLISEISKIRQFQECSVQLTLDYNKVLYGGDDLEYASSIIKNIKSFSSFNMTLSHSNRKINWNVDDELLQKEFGKYRFEKTYIFYGEDSIQCIPSFTSNYISAMEIIDLPLSNESIKKILKIMDSYERANLEIYNSINSD
jgi:hypothetical protein